MRWFIEVSSGNPTGPAEQWVVEASQWQPALQAARALRGEPIETTGFSIELLEDGFRVIDPATLVRYVVRRAPDNTPLSATNTTRSEAAAISNGEPPPSAAPAAVTAEPLSSGTNVDVASPPAAHSGSPVAAATQRDETVAPTASASTGGGPLPAPSRAPSVAPPPAPAAAVHAAGAPGSTHPPAPGVPAVDMSGMTQAERIAAMLSVDPTPRTSSRAPRPPSSAPKSTAPKSAAPKGAPRSVPAASSRNGGATGRPTRASEAAPTSASGAVLHAPQGAALRAPRAATVAEAPPAPPPVVAPVVQSAPDAPPAPAAAPQPSPPRPITQPPAGPVVQSLTELQALVHHNAPPRPSQPPPTVQSTPPQAPAQPPPAVASQPPPADDARISPSVHPSPSSPPEPLPLAELLFQRSEDPSAASPLTYREAAWAVPEGTSIGAAVRLLAGMFEGVRAALAGVKPGKLVYMAIFDHRFVGKPTRPPLATLTWKDWKDQGQGPEIRRQGEPRTSFQPPPITDSFIPAAVPQPPPAIPQALPPVSSMGHAVVPAAPQPVPAAPPPASYQVAAPPAPAIPSPYGASPEAVAAPPTFAPAAVSGLAGLQGPDTGSAAGAVAAAPVDASAAAVPVPAAPKLVIVAEPVTPLPVVVPPAPAPRAAMPSAPAVRLSGVELIADLFECMHDLHFLPDALAGADFVLSLMLDKLPSAVALVHFYDIDAREFVVVRAVGPGAAKVMQIRTNEKEPLIAEAMHKRRAVVLDDAATDPRAQNGRWAVIGEPPRSLVCAPVEEGGRFLGLLELSNPLDGQPFREGDGHAITYIGEQFAEFLAARGVILDAERIGN